MILRRVFPEPRDPFASKDAVVVARTIAAVVAMDVAVACVAVADAVAALCDLAGRTARQMRRVAHSSSAGALTNRRPSSLSS